MEQLRGNSINDHDVQSSVVNLFSAHADKLALPGLHVVYTVPPYLKILSPGMGGDFGTGAVQVFPPIKLRSHAGEAYDRGTDTLCRVLRARGDVDRLFGDDSALREFAGLSGGHLRDLLRMTAEVIRRAQSVPIEREIIEGATSAMRAEYLPIADNHARWLARIAKTHEAELSGPEAVTDLAWFFDTHLVLCFRNSREWYDVNPLIRDIVLKQGGGSD